MQPRSVIVTGGTGFLGTDVVAAFLAGGDRVTVSYLVPRERERLATAVAERSLSVEALALVAADVATAEGAAALLRAAEAHAGPPQVAVLLAGGWAGGATVGDAPVAQWHDLATLNVATLWHAARAALPALARHGGVLVTVGSRAVERDRAGSAAYAAAKSAVATLTQALAEEYRDAGVRANCVLPSVMDTPANRAAMPDADFASWVPTAQVAGVIHWLCSDAAEPVSGALVPVYGRA